MAVNIELLTDDDIIDYTRSNGKDRVIINHYDLDLQRGRPWPVPGGLYDTEIFGSPFEDRCVCGKIRRVSSEPCPNCGARVFSKEDGLRRLARIELPFYYLNDLRYEIFKDLFDKIFEKTEIILDFQGDDFKNDGYAGRGGKKWSIKVFDTCQFEYSKTKNQLKVSEFITDEKKCSYEGLLAIIEKHFPEHLTEFRKMINRYYIVLPAMMRPFSVVVGGATKKMNSHKLSVWYSIVVKLCCVDDKKANKQNYEDMMSKLQTPGERVRYTALLRAFLNVGKKQATGLLNTSKKNEARDLYKVRVKNSARTPIIPSTELPIDEIGVPTYLAYEMCREGFCNYLMDKLNFTRAQAKEATKKEALNPETQKLFKEYAEQQIVVVNRAPTLHEYSMFAMKLRLVDGDTIALPIANISSMNADFDGDTVSIILVPEEVKEDTYNKMSPRFTKFYKKSLTPLYNITHESLNGANVATSYVFDDQIELTEPRYFYDDYKKLLTDVTVDKVIKIGTPIVFTGKIGSVDYQNKITSYGRLRTSKIIDADIDKIGIFNNEYEALKAGSAGKLVRWLYQFDDFVEKMNELQKFWLKCVTEYGVVTFDFKTLYVDTNNETYTKIRNIADSDKFTEQQKLLLITDLYAKYEKEVEERFSDDLKSELSRANRVKISSIQDINQPQMIISGVDEKVIVNKGSLLSGLSEKEYIYHAVENRSLIDLTI